jgi:hypothetical protein
MFGQYLFAVSRKDLQLHSLIQQCPASGHKKSRKTHLVCISQVLWDNDHKRFSDQIRRLPMKYLAKGFIDMRNYPALIHNHHGILRLRLQLIYHGHLYTSRSLSLGTLLPANIKSPSLIKLVPSAFVPAADLN